MITTRKQFTTKLGSLSRNMKATGTLVQDLLVFAFKHYGDPINNSDTSLLGMIMDRVVKAGTVDGRKVKAYIEAHANVRYTKIVNKNDETQYVFKRDASADKAVVTWPKLAWNVWMAEAFEPKPIDEAAFIQKSISSLQNYINKGRVKSKSKARKILECLEHAQAEAVGAAKFVAKS